MTTLAVMGIANLVLALIGAVAGGALGLFLLWWFIGRKERAVGAYTPLGLPGMRAVQVKPASREQPTPDRVAADERPAARLVVIHEPSLLAGAADAVIRHPIGRKPLTIGASPFSDIILPDPNRSLGGEMARVWVQNDGVMFHYISSFSAMATDGYQDGWTVLEAGDCLEMGEYKLVFETLAEVRPEVEPAIPQSNSLGQIWPLSVGDPDTN